MSFKFLNLKYFTDNNSFLKKQQIDEKYLVDDVKKTLIVSHIWEMKEHPDPLNMQFNQVKMILSDSGNYDSVFYDYSCLPQSPRSSEDEFLFKSLLHKMNDLYKGDVCASEVLQLYNDERALERGWPYFESFCATQNNDNPKCTLIPKSVINYKKIVKLDFESGKILMALNYKREAGLVDDFCKLSTIYDSALSLLTSHEFPTFIEVGLIKSGDPITVRTKIDEDVFKTHEKTNRSYQYSINKYGKSTDPNSPHIINFISLFHSGSQPTIKSRLSYVNVWYNQLPKIKDYIIKQLDKCFIHQVILDLNFATFTNGSDRDALIVQMINK
jgi:hypothetical protein